MTGQLIAVFGLGRSGVSVARAALKVGAVPMVLDEGPGTSAAALESRADLESAGVKVITGWDGAFADVSPDLVVTSPGVPMQHPKLREAQASGLEVIGEVEFAYRIAKAPILAVTGTNGKSTTVVMAYLCAEALGLDPILCGNIYGSGYDEVPLTDAASSARADQLLVAEISSFQLEWVQRFRPKAAAITNITEDHLNRYADFAEYAATKQRIYAAQGAEDTAVVVADDRLTWPAHSASRLWRIGAGAEAEVTPDRLRVLGAELAKSELPFTEPHNFQNALTASLLGLACSQAPEASAGVALRALKQFRGLRHRMERLGERDGVLVINNSMCTNPAAVVSSSRSVPRRQHLLMGGINKGMDFGPVGEHLRATGHTAYLFGRDGAQIRMQLSGEFPVFDTMADAFDAACQAARPGEAILLAPGLASTDQFHDFRDRGEAFRRLALEWLNA